MKNMILKVFLTFLTVFIITGCTTNEKEISKKEFSISETAKVNDTIIKINSVKKITKDCLFKYLGKCESYSEPKNDFFLLFDITIENHGKEEISISSILNFDLKNTDGSKGQMTFLNENITSELDGNIMTDDLLKGQIAYDVKQDDKYYLYYQNTLLDNNIKFIINNSDITE